MRSCLFVYLLLLLLILVISPTLVNAKRSKVDLTSEEIDESDGYVVQINPDYDDDDDDDNDRDHDSDKDSEEEDQDEYDSHHDDDDDDVDKKKAKETKKSKSALAKALAKTRKTPQNALKLLKRNKTKIVFALAVFAFRRELKKAIVHILGTPIVDPETGKVIGHVIKIQPTNIIKILVFFDVMRRITKLSGGNGDGAQSSLPLAAALLGGPNSILFSQLISTLLMPSNPAYIPPIEQHYTFERINERYSKDSMALSKAMSTPSQKTQIKMPKSLLGDFNKTSGAREHSKEVKKSYNGTSIILELKGLDTMVAQAHDLNDKVSFLLEEHRGKNEKTNTTSSNSTDQTDSELEVIILLESPGGSAAEYGLAAQQILRLRDEPGIQVTVIVDKVAASGGYMMACTSSPGRLYAAPFAVVGSIGVIGQTVNIHNALESWGVKPLVFRGGKHKAPVGLIGEVSEDGMKTIQKMIDKTHNAFKRHVLAARPKLAKQIDDVATGDVWLGCDALDVGLIDRVITSDEYISQRLRDGVRVLKLINYDKRRFPFAGIHPPRPVAKLFSDASNVLSKVSLLLADQVSLAKSDDVDIQASARSFTTKLQSNTQYKT